MSVQFESRPDVLRGDAGLVKAGTWDVGTSARQRQAVEAIREAWGSRDWPHQGLLSYTVHAGDDGKTLFHYSQWSGEGAYQEFVASGRDARNTDIDAAVPGIRRLGLHVRALPLHGTERGRHP